MAANYRQKFITSCISFMRKYKFDGIDVDWEYPGFRPYSTTDYEAFPTLLEEMYQAFKIAPEKFLLTIAAPSGEWILKGNYNLQRIHKVIDYINVMAYDMHSTNESKLKAHTDIRDGQLSIDYFKS